MQQSIWITLWRVYDSLTTPTLLTTCGVARHSSRSRSRALLILSMSANVPRNQIANSSSLPPLALRQHRLIEYNSDEEEESAPVEQEDDEDMADGLGREDHTQFVADAQASPELEQEDEGEPEYRSRRAARGRNTRCCKVESDQEGELLQSQRHRKPCRGPSSWHCF